MPLTQTEATTIPSTIDEQVTNKSCVPSSPSSIKPRQRRILVVGDGNFSYSLSLIKQHQSRVTDDQPIHLTATSYDSYEELIKKYPESKRIRAQLRELGVTVLHRVDATNLRESLVAAGANKQKLQFHSVIFNHPHCGEENIRRHQSLLSHFYASALNVLEEKDEDDVSGILLTLAEGQSERWQAVPRALSGGLKLYRKVDDVDNDETFGVVFERKRHQNGKSFHHVTLHGEKKKQSSTLFIFRRQESRMEADFVHTTKTKAAPVVGGDEAMTVSRKRKAEREQVFEFACTQCNRSFKSSQGLRTHVHMVHELEAGGVLQKAFLQCKFCSRTFNTEDARRQHLLAKHGKDPLIKPDWFEIQQHEANTAASESTTVPTSGTNGVSRPTTSVAVIAKPKTCAICEFSFATVEDFDAHWQKLQPRAAVKRQCSNCGREFDEERALRQHQNFCSQKDATK